MPIKDYIYFDTKWYLETLIKEGRDVETLQRILRMKKCVILRFLSTECEANVSYIEIIIQHALEMNVDSGGVSTW